MSLTANNVSIVCYDIANDKLRRVIEKCLRDFGARLQYSVFICRLDADGMALCREKLTKVVTAHQRLKTPSDSLIVFERISPAAAGCLLGGRFDYDEPAYGVV